MNNCLVTKLNAPVDLPELKHIGQLDIDFKFTENSPTSNRVNITTVSPITWECTADCYDKASTAQDRVNLGRDGVLSIGTSALYMDEDAKLIIYPMYGMTDVNIPSKLTGMLDLTQVVIDSATLTINGLGGLAFYGEFEKLPYNIKHKRFSTGSYVTYMPLSKNLKGYSKYTYEGTGLLYLETPKEGANYWNNWFLENYMDEDADLCGILAGNNVAQNLEIVNIGFETKGIVSNVAAFASCPMLRHFIIRRPKKVMGSFASAFKNSTTLEQLIYVPITNTAYEDVEDLLDPMAAVRSAGDTLKIIGSYFKLNGAPLSNSSFTTFTFDGQGGWSVTS